VSDPSGSVCAVQIDGLMSQLPGRVLTPGDDGWEAARRFHSGAGDPDVIVRAASVDDVSTAVRWAAAEGVPIVVRSGGHSAWGTVPGGLTLDLGALNGVEVDRSVVRIGGGATWGQVAAVLADHGLGVSSGDTASVGVGGLTLGGGIGWMVRAWGLAADQLIGAQLVTTSGEAIDVTDAAYPELMWALRGGGGNFGVVTRFDFRAHPLPAVVFATLTVIGDARAVLRAMRDTLADAPRELTVSYMDVPAMDPSAPAGATLTAVWAGADESAARAALAPLLNLDDLEQTDVDVMRYPDILLDVPPEDPETPAPGFVGGNTLLPHLSDEAIDQLVSFREANAASVSFLRSLGGAYADVPQDASAFPARDATWFAMAGAFDVPGLVDDETRPAIATAWDAIEALGSGVYGNFTVSTDATFAAKMYPATTMARLSAVKRAWDPTNVFSRNHNVPPA
jgi:FAD/FMN-containing dehydrogenase